MVKDAEAHAAEDKKRKETVEARNHLDSLVYSTEKSLKEYDGDLDVSVKETIEDARDEARASPCEKRKDKCCAEQSAETLGAPSARIAWRVGSAPQIDHAARSRTGGAAASRAPSSKEPSTVLARSAVRRSKRFREEPRAWPTPSKASRPSEEGIRS